MTITAHVYQVYVAATPQQVWAAVTDSEWTRRWFHGTSFVEPPGPGRPYRTVQQDGSDAVDGTIEEMVPPTDGAPGRFVQTWHVLYDAAMSQEPPSRVEWTIEAAGDGLTRVRLVHGDLAASPLTWASTKDGWVWLLDNLKTVLETGRALPRAVAGDDPPPPTSGDFHRRQAVEANNSVWDLLGKDPRSADDDEELLRRAYAAAYHWQRATGAGPENEARACWLVAKVLLVTGQPEASLRSADRCLAACAQHGLVDFDLAYAHEARARALAAVARTDEASAAWALAVSVPVADAEDREVLERDLADVPPGLTGAPTAVG